MAAAEPLMQAWAAARTHWTATWPQKGESLP